MVNDLRFLNLKLFFATQAELFFVLLFIYRREGEGKEGRGMKGFGKRFGGMEEKS